MTSAYKERKRAYVREYMRELRKKEKFRKIFAVEMEKLLISLQYLPLMKQPAYIKLFTFKGMPFFLPVESSSEISEKTLLKQKYEVLKGMYEVAHLPFDYTFKEFLEQLEEYKKLYKIECVEAEEE